MSVCFFLWADFFLVFGGAFGLWGAPSSLLVFGAQQAAFGLWGAASCFWWGRSKLLFCAASCFFAQQAAFLRSKLLFCAASCFWLFYGGVIYLDLF